MSLEDYRARYNPLLDQELRQTLSGIPDLATYYGMMRYHMGWLDADLDPLAARAGKRLRPLLCMLVCEAVGGPIEHALPAAAAIELVHNFSLIHDDIEDDSDTRRHRTDGLEVVGTAARHQLWGRHVFAAALLRLAHLAERGVPPRSRVGGAAGRDGDVPQADRGTVPGYGV